MSAYLSHNPWGDLGTINSDNTKVNANALERIAELEAALLQLERILTYDDNYSAMDMHKIIRDVLSEQHSQIK